MTPPVKIAVVGAGDRGRGYARYALNHPDEARVTAVVEPRRRWRDVLLEEHSLNETAAFDTIDDFIAAAPSVDAIINATPDRAHVATTRRLVEGGHRNILLEKPAAESVAGLADLLLLAEEFGAHVQIGHVLRYTNFFQAVRSVVQGGDLGAIEMVIHSENVGQLHFAHSYVRGQWARAAESSAFLLAKMCHDFDILAWILDDEFTSTASFGELSYFTSSNAPAGAPERCLDGCPIRDGCRFYAPRLYLNQQATWPATTVDIDPSDEARIAALETGDYGRCVYRCDNDVPDHQSVLAQTRRGISVSLSGHGMADQDHRDIKIVGTRATLSGRFSHSGGTCTVTTVNGSTYDVDVSMNGDDAGHFHGGGDFGLMRDFVAHVAGGDWTTASTLETAVHSHVAALAAESARLSGSVVDVAEFLALERRTAAGGLR
jgi:predicted dehydrogenase